MVCGGSPLKEPAVPFGDLVEENRYLRGQLERAQIRLQPRPSQEARVKKLGGDYFEVEDGTFVHTAGEFRIRIESTKQRVPCPPLQCPNQSGDIKQYEDHALQELVFEAATDTTPPFQNSKARMLVEATKCRRRYISIVALGVGSILCSGTHIFRATLGIEVAEGTYDTFQLVLFTVLGVSGVCLTGLVQRQHVTHNLSSFAVFTAFMIISLAMADVLWRPEQQHADVVLMAGYLMPLATSFSEFKPWLCYLLSLMVFIPVALSSHFSNAPLIFIFLGNLGNVYWHTMSAHKTYASDFLCELKIAKDAKHEIESAMNHC